MRKVILLILIGLIMGCAKPQILEQPYSPDQILHLSQYRTLADLDGINRHVCYLNPGDRIPFKMKIESDFIGLVQDQVELIAKKKLYFKIALSKGLSQQRLDEILALTDDRFSKMTTREKKALFQDVMIFIGLDGNRWAPLNDQRAIKEIFGIESGEFSLGMAMSEKEGLWTMLSMQFNKRLSP